MALVLIGVPLLAWTLMRGEAWAAWRAFPWIPGLALIAVLVVPWYALAEMRTPGFLNYFLAGEHWHRFVTPGWQGDLYGNAHRYAPGTIWIFAFGALFPWSVLLPVSAAYRHWKRQATYSPPRDRAWTLYLLLWGLTPLLFFTAARNIIWTYVLPGLTALSLFGAQWLMKTPLAARRRLVVSGLLTSLVGSVIFAVHLETSGRTENESAKALVAAYVPNTVRGTEGQPLIYVGARPHSAVFYSAGHAKRLDNVAQLAGALPVQGAYVAIRSEALATLQALPLATQVDPIGRFGQHELVRLSPAARLSDIAANPSTGFAAGDRTRPAKTQAAGTRW